MGSRGLASAIWTVLTASAATVCWLLAGPSERRSKEIAQRLPESNKAQLETSRQRNTLVMQVIKETALSEKNIAQEKDWNRLPRSDP